MQRGSTGYSFFDVMITLCLVGVLVTISIPGANTTTKDLDRFAQQTAELFERARGAAQYNEANSHIDITPTLLLLETVDRQLHSVKVPDNFALKSTHERFTYYPSGTNTPGNVQILSNTRRCKLTIALLGKSSLQCGEIG